MNSDLWNLEMLEDVRILFYDQEMDGELDKTWKAICNSPGSQRQLGSDMGMAATMVTSGL